MRDRLSINISVGRSCFVQCRGCYNYFGRHHEPIADTEIVRFLTYLSEHGIHSATLSGGDPLSRPNILRLLCSIKDLGFRLQLDTVGTPLVRNAETIFFGRSVVAAINVEKLASTVDLIGIPLDGSSTALIQQFRRGRDGIYQEILETLDSLYRHGVPVCINTVAHQRNLHDLPNIARLIVGNLAVTKWQVFQYMPIGPLAFKSRSRYEITDQAFESATSDLPQIVAEYGSRVQVEVKSRGSRKGNYMLVDSDGAAWTPATSSLEAWEPERDATPDRRIHGDIREPTDFPRILSAMKNPRGSLAEEAP
jgi:MoaA/NifB/PqqE/SkfB family radical SAM enzyme